MIAVQLEDHIFPSRFVLVVVELVNYCEVRRLNLNLLMSPVAFSATVAMLSGADVDAAFTSFGGIPTT